METLSLTLIFISIVILILTPLLKTGIILAGGSLLGYFYFAAVNSWIPITLIVVGLLLIVLEIFVPDFGLLGILGFGSTVLGLYYTTGEIGKTITDISIALAVSTIFVILLFRKGYTFANWDRFVLNTKITNNETIEQLKEKEQLSIGMIGEAITPLRPSGKAVFGNDLITYDVLSDDGHIARDTKIIIQEIIGNKIVVRKNKIEQR